MHILMILEREFPPDERVEKEIKSLTENGHQLILACYTFHQKPGYEEINPNFSIVRKKISQFVYKSSAACLIFPFYFQFWKSFIKSIIANKNIEALHVHDLPLSKPAYYFKRKYNLKLICDQHEYFSNWIVHTAHYNSLLGKIIKTFSKWKKYEKKYLNRADLVITVEEPLRKCYIKESKILPRKIITLPNRPSAKIFNRKNIKQDIVERYKNDFVIFYAGGIDLLRGLDMVINSLKDIEKEISHVKFLIAGKERKGFNLKSLVKKANVEQLVEFVGWMDIRDLPSYITASNICIFTPPGNREEIHLTIATKIYQYAIMGKPVITSNVKMMKKFVLENKIGFSVSDSKEFAEKVKELYHNKELYHKISENCIKTAKSFTWENSVKPLISFYNNLQ